MSRTLGAVLTAAVSLPLSAQTAAEDEPYGLLLRPRGDAADWSPAPEVATSIAVEVAGIVARTRVEQSFFNPGGETVEARYLFPLPEGAAVDRMEMLAGDRRIVGEVHEKETARRIHRQAKSDGRKSSLLERRRANVYAASISGIEPGEEIVVRIEYQELVRYDSGTFHLRIPLVVAPRYQAAQSSPGARHAGFDSTADLSQPGVLSAGGFGGFGNVATVHAPRGEIERPVHFSLTLDAGVGIANLESSSHRIDARRDDERIWRVGLRDQSIAADRDLEISWRPQRRRRPRVVRFEEEGDGQSGERYVALLFVPPAPELPAQPLARELIIVLDTSGSMAGPSIEQAKLAVHQALDRLLPFDRFNLIRFASDAQPLFDGAVEAGPAALAMARSFVDRIDAGGGTEMLPALDLALRGRVDPTAVRQILFVTDGAVDNENQLFAFLERRLGPSRLFTVGIGSAPNSHFMTGAAALGRGTFTFIGKSGEVAARMSTLLEKLEQPVLADLDLVWDDPSAESYPERPGDLYAGEPLLVLARLERTDSAVHVHGRLADAPFEVEVPATVPLPAPGIGRLWAQRKIAAIEAAMHRRGGDGTLLRDQIVELAIAHRIVTRFTSFVAVEQRPSLPAGAVPVARAVPALLPAGYAGGELPQGGSRATLELGAALAALAVGLVLSRIGRRRPLRALRALRARR